MIATPALILLAAGAAALSGLLVAPFAYWLRPKAVGLGLVAILLPGAALGELAAERLVGLEFGTLLVLLLVAPVAEELLKLGCTGASWKRLGGLAPAAVSAGLGFALVENAIYFLDAAGAALGAFLLLVGVRAITDPLVHTAGASLSAQSLRGSVWGLPAAVILHASWNLLTLLVAGQVLPPAIQVLILLAPAAPLGVLVAYARRRLAGPPLGALEAPAGGRGEAAA